MRADLKCSVQRLEGKAVDVPPEDPLRDTDRLRHYLYHAEDAGGTRPTNSICSSPRCLRPRRSIRRAGWRRHRPGMIPNLYSSPATGTVPTRKWSTEMLYRSWATMHDIAGYPFDDWWDLPYEALIKNSSGSARAAASVHRSRDKCRTGYKPGGEARRAEGARRLLRAISAASSKAAAERSSRPLPEK